MQINRHRQEKMDVLRGLRGGDPYQEFRKGEGLQGLQASVRAAAAGGGGFRATAASVPDVASSLHGSPLVPSMSGGYSFQKSSDIQEVGKNILFPPLRKMLLHLLQVLFVGWHTSEFLLLASVVVVLSF